LSLARGVPVIQQHALKILDACGLFERALPSAALADYFVIGAWLAGRDAYVLPTRECRESFHRAFGLSPEDQAAWEGSALAVSFDRPVLDGCWPSEWLGATPGLFEPWRDAAD
jgi:hypothetical protein